MDAKSLLKPFIARHWPTYTAGIILLIAVDLLQLLIPRLTGQAVDLLAAQSFDALPAKLAALIVIGLVIAVLRYFFRECIMGTTRQLEYYLREKIFGHALRLPMTYFDRQGPGKIMALTTNDVSAIRVAVGLGMILLIDGVVMGLISLLTMAGVVNWRLAVVAVAPLPLIMVLVTLMGQAVHQRFHLVQERFSSLTEYAQEIFAGAKVIKGFAAEKTAIRRFARVSQENVDANLSLARLQSAYVPVTHTLPLLCYALTLYYGGLLMMEHTISLGEFTAFIGYLGLVIWPVMGMGYLVNTVERGKASFKRIIGFLNEKLYEDDMTETVEQLPQPDITIDDLTFYYNGAAVPSLSQLHLHIPAGAVVGVVGKPGAGKSTLLRLLLRLYDPPQGTIYLSGREIHDIDYMTLRRSIGYVPQHPMLFSRTIEENIAFGGTAGRGQVYAAAQLAAVENVIAEKQEGMATMLGENGRRLSGGQQQRVAIARAVAHAPSLLLFDDVFSALDYRTQAQLLNNLRQFTAGRTAIIVSQRVIAIKEADFIAVMDRGAIVECGKHEELVKKRGLYFQLYEQQLVDGGGDVHVF